MTSDAGEGMTSKVQSKIGGLLVVLVTGLVPLTSHAGMRLSLYGGLQKSDSVLSGGTGVKGSFAPGGGIGLEFPLGSSTGLEIDGFYLQRKIIDTFTYVEVPVLFRVWLGRTLTLGAGAYFANGMSSNFAASGLAKTDFGAVGAVGLNIPVGRMSLGVEGRYEYGLWDASIIKDVTLSFNSLQILLTIRFGGGRGLR